MHEPFRGAFLKLERAKEHINDLQTRAQFFADTHPHVISINRDEDTSDDILSISPAEPFPVEFSVILGDALHNLRAALDHAWFGMIRDADRHTKFPVRETRDGFEAAIGGVEKRACEDIIRHLKDVIQPYRGGNGEMVLDLHTLDIIDKHSLLIANRQFTVITGLRAVDERGEEFDIDDWLIVPPYTASHSLKGHSRCEITDHGQATARVTFGEGMPLHGRYMMPTLKSFTEIVLGIISDFERIYKANIPSDDLSLGTHQRILQSDKGLTLVPAVRQDRRDLVYYPDRILPK